MAMLEQLQVEIMCSWEHRPGYWQEGATNTRLIGTGDPLSHYATCRYVAPWIRAWALAQRPGLH